MAEAGCRGHGHSWRGRTISCRRRLVVARLSHSFLAAAATFVGEEEGPLTIARSRVDSVAMVVSIP